MTPFLSTYPEAAYGGYSSVDGTIAFYSRVNALLTPESHVVDVGCGRGGFAEDSCAYRRSIRILRGKARLVTGLDVDPIGQENPFLDRFLPIRPGQAWPIESGTADLIVADYVCEHIPDPEGFLHEVARVLKHGGYFCARTPNKLAYPGLISSCIPNRFHARVLGKVQDGRKEMDVFPTFYRMNTAGKLRSLLSACGMRGVIVPVDAEPSYLAFSPFVYKIGAVLHRWIPRPFRANLFVFAHRV